MEKEKIIKPDSGAVKALIGRAAAMDAKLQQIPDTEREQRKAAQTAAQRLHDRHMRQALEEMDIEHINKGKQGIRVSLLRSAGIENVWQASGLSFQKICAIEAG